MVKLWWSLCLASATLGVGAQHAAATSTVRGRYIRIDTVQVTDTGQIINLEEIQAYSKDGDLISAQTVTISAGGTNPERCIDGVKFDSSKVCHSGSDDPWLVG